MKNPRLAKAIQAARNGTAGVDDVAEIATDAARQIGVAAITIDAMTTALQSDQLQRRLDDLQPPCPPTSVGAAFAADDEPNDLITIYEACRKHGVNLGTGRRWARHGLIKSYGTKRVAGGESRIVSETEFLGYRDGPRNKGGRPTKP